MGWINQFKEMANSKPLFPTIIATVIIGAAVTFVYIVSAVFNSSLLNQAFNSPHPCVVNMGPAQTQTSQVEVKPVWEIPPPGSKMPPVKTFLLTKQLAQQRVKDNVIIATFGNYGYMDFILTWVKHLSDMGVDNLLVGAMDTKLLEALYWKGVPVFYMGTNYMSTDDVVWGSPVFHKMGRQKAILVDAILSFGFELLMCDTDMVWLKNPLPFLARFPEADVLTSTDSIVPFVSDDRLELWQRVGSSAYNIGMFHWRPTNSSKKLAKEWKEMLLADAKIWDQSGFNHLVRRRLGPSVDEENALVYAYDGELKLGILPQSIFCNGHTYFVGALYNLLGLQPYAIHTNFQYTGSKGKRYRLREAMAFYDPPEYYDPPGGLFTFKPSIPKSLLLEGEHNRESHIALVNYQLKQIRDALAVALVLNRTLVMPKLWCRFDRLWFGIKIQEDVLTRYPFLCPMEQIFKVNVMLEHLPEEKFGPPIRFREYSLFDNPSMPQKVKESWLDVHLCQEGSQSCQVSNNATTSLNGGVVKFPKRSNEAKYMTVFSAFKDVKVIQFTSMQDAFSGFIDKTREEKFRNRVKRYTYGCCGQRPIKGHIYYDMYWDEKLDLLQTP